MTAPTPSVATALAEIGRLVHDVPSSHASDVLVAAVTEGDDASVTRLEDVEILEPGQESYARIHPLAPEFWTGVRPGQEIYELAASEVRSC